jgi:glycosyltransferase involved in cell wall biosynthesis
VSEANHPLITIGITCFNAEDFIGQAIESAQNQTWPNIEIIVVDDASSDGSLDRIHQLAEADQRIRLIRHDVNKGYPSALNTIVQHANGEFIAIFDDDDISVPDRLLQQWRRLTAYEAQEETDLVFCYSNRDVIRSGESEPHTIAYAIGRQPPEPHGTAVADNILWRGGDRRFVWGMFGSCTLMVRHSSLQKMGNFDEDFRRSAEWDMAIRVAFTGGHFIAVDQSLVVQRKTPTSEKSRKISLHYAQKLRRKYKDYLKRKGVYLASVIIGYSGKSKYRLRYNILRILAGLAAPRRMFWDKLLAKFNK